MGVFYPTNCLLHVTLLSWILQAVPRVPVRSSGRVEQESEGIGEESEEERQSRRPEGTAQILPCSKGGGIYRVGKRSTQSVIVCKVCMCEF